MAKKIRVSSDAGVTLYTLPGSQGEMKYEAGDMDDTIFGQDFKSMEVGIINWSLTSNAYFKGFAGYVADLKQVSGSSTLMTADAMTFVSGKTYQVTNAAHRILDRLTAPIILDNAVAVAAANIQSIDYLFGRVTFISSYTPTTPITITAKWFATSIIAKGRSFTLTQTAEAVQNTVFETAQANGGHHTFQYGLKTVSLEIGGVFDATNDFQDAVKNRLEMIIEINPDGSNQSVARGYFKAMTQGQSGNVGALEEETISFTLSVPPVDNMESPFMWAHTATTLSTAVQKLITAWTNKTELLAQYLPTGNLTEGGKSGQVIVTELSLSGGLEAMNEFAVTLQGTGITTDA